MKRFLFIILFFVFELNAQTAVVQNSFEDVVIFNFSRYPEMQVEDYYKLAHQASMGNEHLSADSAMFAKYFEKEIKEIIPASDDNFLEKLSSDNDIVRVNLKPYLFFEKNTKLLLNAMIQTANKFEKSKSNLKKYLNKIIMLARKEKIGSKAKELESFFNLMESKDFPAVHHSKTYNDLYQPSYRVISLKYLKEK